MFSIPLCIPPPQHHNCLYSTVQLVPIQCSVQWEEVEGEKEQDIYRKGHLVPVQWEGEKKEKER